MIPFDGSGPVGWATAAGVGMLLGWLLERVVGGWLADCEREWGAMAVPAGPDAATARGTRGPTHAIAVAFALASVALWWWEVRVRGLLPVGVDGPVGGAAWVDACRWCAHVALLWLLAAATWIDFRFRVIPDWITTRGFLAGLAAVWALPGILLPVAALQGRQFAAAVEVPDVLGWAGPLEATLRATSPGSPWSLAAAAGLFLVWWWVATGPADRFADGVEADGIDSDGGGTEGETRTPSVVTEGPAAAPGASDAPPRVDAARFAVLAVGLVGVSLAWWMGGTRFAALESALAGAVVAGGLVWATRAGGSLALGREAMGLGDVTLMAMAGAWLGWQACVLACFLGVLIGLVHGVWHMAGGRGSELPFGPSLCAGVGLVVAGWRTAWSLTGESFAEPGRMAAVLLAVVIGTAVSLFVWSRLPDGARRLVLLATLLLLALLVVWANVGGGG